MNNRLHLMVCKVRYSIHVRNQSLKPEHPHHPAVAGRAAYVTHFSSTAASIDADWRAELERYAGSLDALAGNPADATALRDARDALNAMKALLESPDCVCRAVA